MSAWAVGADLYSRFGDEFVDKLAIRRKWNNVLNDYVADESQVGKDAVIALALDDAKAMILQKLSCYYSDLTSLDTLNYPAIKQWHILLTIETLKRGGQCYGCECIAPMEEYFKCGSVCSDNGVCLVSKKTFISATEAEFCCEVCDEGCCSCS